MPKITFMGAGSTVFAKNVLGDSLLTPSLAHSDIALYDIDAKRLEESELMLKAINKWLGNPAKIYTYLGVKNRKEALRGGGRFGPERRSARGGGTGGAGTRARRAEP